MRTSDGSLASALARLQGRWGSAAIRLGNGDPASVPEEDPRVVDRHQQPQTVGALALVPEVVPDPAERSPADPLAPLGRDIVSTGFPALDAVLGPGGLPRQASAAIRGDVSSGKTTLALRCVAEAQQTGTIAAWLDLARAFDPLEAVARGVDLRWLLVVRARDPTEGFAICGALLLGHAVDLLVLDLPARMSGRHDDAIRRLVARAQRVGARLLVLEPVSMLNGGLQGAVAEATGLRLELDRSDWIRLDRDVIGQRTRVTVAKNRFGPPGRNVDLDIHYADGGDRRLETHRFAGA